MDSNHEVSNGLWFSVVRTKDHELSLTSHEIRSDLNNERRYDKRLFTTKVLN